MKDNMEIKGKYKFELIEILEPIEKRVNIDREKLQKYKGRELVSSLKKDITINKNDYSSIEFCKFKLRNQDMNKQGVYLWVVDDDIIYVGEASNLQKRFNTGYGNISPRNIFKGGQSTNCKMNRVAMKYFASNKKIMIYFYETSDYKKIERELLQYNKENNKWNLYNSKV